MTAERPVGPRSREVGGRRRVTAASISRLSCGLWGARLARDPVRTIAAPRTPQQTRGARSHQQTDDCRRHIVLAISGGSPRHLACPAARGARHPAPLLAASAARRRVRIRRVADDRNQRTVGARRTRRCPAGRGARLPNRRYVARSPGRCRPWSALGGGGRSRPRRAFPVDGLSDTGFAAWRCHRSTRAPCRGGRPAFADHGAWSATSLAVLTRPRAPGDGDLTMRPVALLSAPNGTDVEGVPPQADEALRLARELRGTITELLAARQTIELQRVELDRAASVDSTTGTATRRAILERLRMEAAEARRYAHPIALVLIDLDGTRGLNRTYGVEIGDEILRELGLRLRLRMRAAG